MDNLELIRHYIMAGHNLFAPYFVTANSSCSEVKAASKGGWALCLQEKNVSKW